MLDPRITPVRPDLAAAHLRGQVDAPRFAEGALRRVREGVAPVRAAPRFDAPLLTESLHGEAVTIYDEEEGWVWAQLADDGYVGWLPAAALGPHDPAPTHRIKVLRTLVFPGPDIKLPPVGSLSLNAAIHAAADEGQFLRLASGGYVWASHVCGMDAAQTDMAGVAMTFANVPYLWGGKSALGIDCSGLVQMAAAACGRKMPRDSDLQYDLADMATVKDWSPQDLRRDDLIFWKGHVALALGDGRMVHANAHHMMVAVEDVAAGIARIREAGSEVLGIRRF